MIFDSQEQKEFIFKILRSYVCPYGESLVINHTHAPAINGGAVVSPEKQKEWLAPPTPIGLGDNQMQQIREHDDDETCEPEPAEPAAKVAE